MGERVYEKKESEGIFGLRKASAQLAREKEDLNSQSAAFVCRPRKEKRGKSGRKLDVRGKSFRGGHTENTFRQQAGVRKSELKRIWLGKYEQREGVAILQGRRIVEK